jgi:hypothetical protein
MTMGQRLLSHSSIRTSEMSVRLGTLHLTSGIPLIGKVTHLCVYKHIYYIYIYIYYIYIYMYKCIYIYICMAWDPEESGSPTTPDNMGPKENDAPLIWVPGEVAPSGCFCTGGNAAQLARAAQEFAEQYFGAVWYLSLPRPCSWHLVLRTQCVLGCCLELSNICSFNLFHGRHASLMDVLRNMPYKQ